MRTGLNTIDAYYKAAMEMPLERLQNIVRGREHSIPVAAAMMALEVKTPMVNAAKGQEAAQQPPQPTVRDQMEEKMGMLPENIGLGALPAQNMEQMGAPGMAEGGIVAFAGNEGSVVEEKPWWASGLTDLYQQSQREGLAAGDNTSSTFGRAVAPLADAFFGKAYTSDTRSQLYSLDEQYRQLDKQRRQLVGPFGLRSQTPAEQAQADTLERQLQAISAKMNEVRNAPQATVRAVREAQNAEAKKVATQGDYPAAQWAAVTDAIKKQQAQQQPPQFKDARTAPPQAGSTRAGVRASVPMPAGGIPLLTPGKEASLEDTLAAVTKASGVGEISKQQAGLESLIEKTNKDAEARFKDRPQYTPYEKYEKSIQKEEEEAKGDKDRNLQMALVNAGLAIAGGKSQYALSNIAEGAQVGTKQYSEGLKDLKAAAKERQKAMAMIEEARNAKTDKDYDRYEALMSKSEDRMIASKQHGIEALAKTLQITVPQATSIYNNMKDNASREAVANMQARVQSRGQDLQYQASMAHTGALQDSNVTQKLLMAQQRGETAYKNWLESFEGKQWAAKAGSDPKASQYLAERRNWYLQNAHETAGLPYTTGAQPSAAEDAQFKVLGPKP